MSKFVHIILCLFFITLLSKSENYVKVEQEDELVAVAVLFRHGDRSLINSYPSDPYYNESYWPDGYEQLLNVGKCKQYNLGKWLRKRYDSFLSKNYKKTEMMVLSSGIDRTLMSAAATLAGLYIPTENTMWVKGLPWEPVPIHSWPKALDPYFSFRKPCPRHEVLVEDLFEKHEQFKNLPIEYREEYDIAAKNTGLNVTLHTFRILYSAFEVYESYNKSFLPSWAKSFNKTKFTYLAGLSLAANASTPSLKILRGGPLFNKLLGFFDKANNSTTEPKFLIMSAHDSTITVALQVMGVYDFVPPEFSAMVIWELHRDQSGEKFMKIYYRRPSRDNLEELILPDCKKPCTYKMFHIFISQFARDEETIQECCKITR